MRLGVSNLAWGAKGTATALERLAALGVTGIEVAPTRIASWETLGNPEVAEYQRQISAAGLQISSLQAVFFGRPELQLLGDNAVFDAMLEHMRRVAGVAETLGARVAVFGAPRNRTRGALPEAEAEARAVERLRVLGDVAQASGLVLGMEPVPPCYGADFLLRAADVRRVVGLCDHPGIRTHLDSACVTLAGDAIADEVAATGGSLAHYHIAEPNLGGFDSPTCLHAAAGEALRRAGYSGWLVIEMLQQADGFASVEISIRFAQGAYG